MPTFHGLDYSVRRWRSAPTRYHVEAYGLDPSDATAPTPVGTIARLDRTHWSICDTGGGIIGAVYQRRGDAVQALYRRYLARQDECAREAELLALAQTTGSPAAILDWGQAAAARQWSDRGPDDPDDVLPC